MKSDFEKVVSNVQSYNLNDYTVVVFGAGNTSILYQKCFEREGIRPVYYVDNDKAKHDTVFQGVPVISVEKLVALRQTFAKPPLVLICSAQITVCDQISLQLQKCGLTYTTVDAFVFRKNADKINAVCDLLGDDLSREVYTRVITSRILNTRVPESLVNSSCEQYFLLPQFLKHSEKEVFVDVGAYVGDSVEQYISRKLGMFGKIYAFEPDTLNFQALQHRSVRLKKEWGIPAHKLTLINGAVGSKTERIYLSAAPPHSINNAESASGSARPVANLIDGKTGDAAEVSVYSLDDYFKEQHVGFIKADIESYELDMLRGTESVIKRDKPLLAVCIYHNASDMFTIPLFVKGLCADYTIKIRHHTYIFADTVLYAYIED